MTTFNTGNPLGSSALRDLYDNAENLDEAANSSADTFQDRLGKIRLTWAGIVKAGTGDAGVIVPIVQQAVQDVVDGVDGQVAVAESAADRAEAARDAAFTNADLYETIAEGIAATVVGEQFQVLSADGLEYVRYRHDSGGVATPLPGAIPSVERVAMQIEREGLKAEQPNLFSEEEILFTDSTALTNSAIVERSEAADVGAWKITGAGGHLLRSAVRNFKTARLKGADFFSFSAKVLALEPGADTSDCYIDVKQLDVSGEVIAGSERTFPVAGAAGLLSPVTCAFSAMPVLSGSDSINIRFVVNTKGMSEPRSMWVRDLFLAAGKLAVFTQPPSEALRIAAERSERIKTELERPNLFSANEVAIKDASAWGGAAAMSAAARDGEGAWEISAAPGKWQSKYRYFSRSLIGDANKVSMSLLVLELEPGVDSLPCYVRLNQIDESGAAILSAQQTQYIAGPSGKATPTQVIFEAVDVHPDTVQFQVYLYVLAINMDTSRSMWVREFLFCAGESALFINPQTAPDDSEAAIGPVLTGWKILPNFPMDRDPNRFPNIGHSLGFTCTGACEIPDGPYKGCRLIGDDGRLNEQSVAEDRVYNPHVHLIDRNHDMILQSFPIGGEHSVQGVAVDTLATGTFWVACASGRTVQHRYFMGGNAGLEIEADRIDFDGLGLGYNPNGLAFDATEGTGKGALWVAPSSPSESTVWLVDCDPAAPTRIIRTITLPHSGADQFQLVKLGGFRYLLYSLGSNGANGSIHFLNLDTSGIGTLALELPESTAIEGIIYNHQRRIVEVYNDAFFHSTGAEPRFNMVAEYAVTGLPIS